MSKLNRQQADDTIHFSVYDMPIMGQAKIRHVGGWVIHKLLQGARGYVQSNMLSLYKETQVAVQTHHTMCNMMAHWM